MENKNKDNVKKVRVIKRIDLIDECGGKWERLAEYDLWASSKCRGCEFLYERPKNKKCQTCEALLSGVVMDDIIRRDKNK